MFLNRFPSLMQHANVTHLWPVAIVTTVNGMTQNMPTLASRNARGFFLTGLACWVTVRWAIVWWQCGILHANLWIITTLNRVSSSIFLFQRFLGEVTGDGTYGRKQGPYNAQSCLLTCLHNLHFLTLFSEFFIFLRVAHPLICMSSKCSFRTQSNIARRNTGWFLMHCNVILTCANVQYRPLQEIITC